LINKEHSSLEGIRKAITIKSYLNLDLSKKLKEEFPDIALTKNPEKKENLTKNKILCKNLHPEWIAGFSTGESNFFIRVQKYKNISGLTLSLRFSIAQDSRDLLLLERLIKFFGGGYIMSYKNRPLCEFIITKIDLIIEKVIPLFKKHIIIGSKQLDFLDFCSAAYIIKNKKHLKKEGLEKILELKQKITLRKNNNVTNNHINEQGTDNIDLKR
jgi:LAGLIDADG endonuclease